MNNTKVADIGLTSYIANNSNPSLNKSVYYYASFTNKGPHDASDLRFYIPIPAGSHYVNYWLSWDNGTTWKAAINLNGTYNYTDGFLKVGSWNNTTQTYTQNGVLKNGQTLIFSLRVVIDEIHKWFNFSASKYWQNEEDRIKANDNTSVSIYAP